MKLTKLIIVLQVWVWSILCFNLNLIIENDEENGNDSKTNCHGLNINIKYDAVCDGNLITCLGKFDCISINTNIITWIEAFSSSKCGIDRIIFSIKKIIGLLIRSIGKHIKCFILILKIQ